MQRSLELHKIAARGAAHRGGRKDIPILTFLKHGTQKTLVKLKHLNFKHFLRFTTLKDSTHLACTTHLAFIKHLTILTLKHF